MECGARLGQLLGALLHGLHLPRQIAVRLLERALLALEFPWEGDLLVSRRSGARAGSPGWAIRPRGEVGHAARSLAPPRGAAARSCAWDHRSRVRCPSR